MHYFQLALVQALRTISLLSMHKFGVGDWEVLASSTYCIMASCQRVEFFIIDILPALQHQGYLNSTAQIVLSMYYLHTTSNMML